jgi:multidrug resistance efflux pump
MDSNGVARESGAGKVPDTLARSPESVLSHEGRDFMGRPPHWLLRSGTIALAGMLGLILVLGTVIKYPDTINARITITGTDPVVELVARQNGHLESLRVRERQTVRKGEILAIIRSPSQAETVLALSQELALLSAEMANETTEANLPFTAKEGLGRLQDSYAEFLWAYRQFRSLLKDDYAERVGKLLRQEAEARRNQIGSLRLQSTLTLRELDISRSRYERLKALNARNVISSEEVQKQEMTMLQQMRTDADAQRTIADAEVEAVRLEKELQDIEHQRAEALRLAREQLRVSLNKLRGQVDLWEADYVLRAPINGIVSFYDFWSDQQYVTAGSQVFLIVPETTRLLGRMPVNQGGAGKVKPGQVVRIRIDDYPYREFGAVTGRVQSVSLVPREGANLVLVDIPYPLVTSFKKHLQFKQEMVGEASIVTQDIRLIDRFFYEIRRAFVS